ncbi:MAG: Hsp20/alpha crystallin family protein [Patescibacteria group bacterium]
MTEKPKKSFFERLTGAINVGPLQDEESSKVAAGSEKGTSLTQNDDDVSIGELAVDVHQTADSVVIKCMVAGVRPEDLDVSITRDSVTIRGKRSAESAVTERDYVVKELYWGEFMRTIVLPTEVEADEAEAQEKHGLLMIRIPKIDKNKQTRLRVKSI